MKRRSEEITLKSIIDIFVPKLWIICLVAVVCAVAFALFSMSKPDTYTSTGKYIFDKYNYSDEDLPTGLNPSEVTGMQTMIANAREIINTNDFASEVKNVLTALKHDPMSQVTTGIVITDVDLASLDFESMSLSDIRDCMSVVPCDSDTTCYYLSVTLHDAKLARVIADVAGALLVERYEDKKYAVHINKLDTPNVPSSPNGKGTVKNAAIGFLIGMLATMFIIFVFSSFDVIVRSRERLEEKFDIPIIGVIPRLESDN